MGTAIIVLGLSIGATFLYIFANYFLKELIREKFLNKFQNLEIKFRKSEFNYLLLYRFIGGIPWQLSCVLPTIFDVKVINFFWATLIGIIAGIILPLGVSLIDKLKLDDPVGAIAVHLICGIWGTLAVGIFGAMASVDQFINQLIGVGVIGAFSVICAGIIIFAIKSIVGIRVSEEEELKGLDISEHSMDAYADFSTNKN